MLEVILSEIRKRVLPRTIKIITDEKVAEASKGAYAALDVVSESDTGGTAWEFADMARKNGLGGYITNAHIIAQTTNIAAWFTLFLFTDVPTCELNDGVTCTALLHADRFIYVGRIDFPACSDIGTGSPDSVATPSTVGNIPISYICKSNSKNLYGVVAIRNAVDLADDTTLTIKLTVEQY